jgi:hypothetical protein
MRRVRRLIGSGADRFARHHDLGVAQAAQQEFVLPFVFRFMHLFLHFRAAGVDAAHFADGAPIAEMQAGRGKGEIPAVLGRAGLPELNGDFVSAETRQRGWPFEDSADVDDGHVGRRL